MRKLTQALAITSTLVGLTYVASADEGEGYKHEKSGQKAESGEGGERALTRVLFDFDSDTPNEDLLMVANNLECTPNETIILDAYTDPVGSSEYNADLAKRRAENVKAELVDLGIDENRIMLGIFGEEGEQRPTHAQDRRVEIRSSAEPVAQLKETRQGTAVAVVAPGGQEVEEVARP